MPSPDYVNALADLGGFGLFLITVIGAVIAVHKQMVVPGWLYKQERAARMRAETQALRNAESLEKLARAVSGDRTRRRAAHEPADDSR